MLRRSVPCSRSRNVSIRSMHRLDWTSVSGIRLSVCIRGSANRARRRSLLQQHHCSQRSMDFLISLSIVPKRQSCRCALCYIATEHNEYSPFCLTSNSLTEPSKTPRNGCLVAQCFDGQNIDEGGSSSKHDRCSHRFAIIVTGHPVA